MSLQQVRRGRHAPAVWVTQHSAPRSHPPSGCCSPSCHPPSSASHTLRKLTHTLLLPSSHLRHRHQQASFSPPKKAPPPPSPHLRSPLQQRAQAPAGPLSPHHTQTSPPSTYPPPHLRDPLQQRARHEQADACQRHPVVHQGGGPPLGPRHSSKAGQRVKCEVQRHDLQGCMDAHTQQVQFRCRMPGHTSRRRLVPCICHMVTPSRLLVPSMTPGQACNQKTPGQAYGQIEGFGVSGLLL